MNPGNLINPKFLEDSQMSFQEVYDFAFKEHIPVLQALAHSLGEETFLELLKEASLVDALRSGQADAAARAPANDFATFNAWAKAPDPFWKHVLTYRIVRDTPQVFEICVTECLWAKTFREIGAEKIGFLLICNPDQAYCQGFNPRISLRRSRTLMQGDDLCDHCWSWKE
jgi:hypothetical protein